MSNILYTGTKDVLTAFFKKIKEWIQYYYKRNVTSYVILKTVPTKETIFKLLSFKTPYTESNQTFSGSFLVEFLSPTRNIKESCVIDLSFSMGIAGTYKSITYDNESSSIKNLIDSFFINVAENETNPSDFGFDFMAVVYDPNKNILKAQDNWKVTPLDASITLYKSGESLGSIANNSETISLMNSNGFTYYHSFDSTDTYECPISYKTVAFSGSEYDIKKKGNLTYQNIFNLVHPVGEIYVQFPNQTAPATLYNKNGITSTWTKVNYSGAFFRAEGGDASTFNSGEQAEGLPNIQGGISSGDSYGGVQGHNSTFTGAFSNSTKKGNAAWSGSTSSTFNLVFDAALGETKMAGNKFNDVYGKSDHVTPVNRTIIVWKRTA